MFDLIEDPAGIVDLVAVTDIHFLEIGSEDVKENEGAGEKVYLSETPKQVVRATDSLEQLSFIQEPAPFSIIVKNEIARRRGAI